MYVNKIWSTKLFIPTKSFKFTSAKLEKGRIIELLLRALLCKFIEILYITTVALQ